MNQFISLDGEVVQHNLSLIAQVHDEVALSAVDDVQGNRVGEVAGAYTDHLDSRASELQARVDLILAYVRKHADALTQAVAALQESDALNATDAQQTLSLVETASRPPADLGASAGGSGGARSALRGIQP
ncbi:hypothetical protein [Microbacterium trichothecenolyticum]|uniref:Uncharacterized protein n=1 Tax=Microbacterium trichothecenolyticum TaxID=69370 RepID=A0ABU0TV90_MICTR|nr:hypothetical protein [Microbacterium trichothecenolyticum]MDQ1123581.1 hypothetical protein [Microbacterium trichothecenolyticum]